MKLLSVRGLSKRFGGIHAVDDVSFDVLQGAIMALIGPNGAGKTTLFHLVSGFLRPDRGSVVFDGSEVLGLMPHQIAARGMARTFQQIRLFPKMSVLENVLVGRHLHSRGGFLACMLNLPYTRRGERKGREAGREILAFLGLSDQADAEAVRLSYGQQRMVELGRALACEPKILLLDEPAAGLNIRETAQVGELISRIRDRGVTVFLVEHDMSLVMDISDEIIVLSYGQKIAEDVPSAIQRDPDVIRIYIGEGDA